jgi:tetratricopeptide (TPR) repeat protein
MKIKYILLVSLAWCSLAFSQTDSDLTEVSGKTQLAKASKLFFQGKYESAISELDSVEKSIIESDKPDQKMLSLIAYLRGLSNNRIQDYPEAIKAFSKALELTYSPKDINYEYGQALYASEKLKEARIQFRESLRKKFKSAVSLYYIAFTTKEIGEKEKALTFFKSMDKLDKAEVDPLRQAVEFQIGDIYLEQVEKHKDAFRAVEKFVIPQYEKALKVDDTSALAGQIKEKIVALQRKYELVLFALRNGRPTAIPAYFIRASQELGIDTNVTFSPNETTVSKSKQSSTYSKTDFIGKYTFYHRDYISVAPEFRFNNVYYFNRVKEIYRNDNQLYAPAVRSSYEYSLLGKPAATLLDYDYNQALRDVNAREKLDFSSRSHTFMLGERFNLFQSGETILRVRHRTFNSYLGSQNSQTWSFVAEQFKSLGSSTLLFYLSIDRARVADETFDTNAATFRTDLIMGQFRNWFSPSMGLSMTRTDPMNNRAARGQETQYNPNLRLYKTFGRIRGAFKYDYMRNFSRDESSFAYKKQTYGIELEYIF